MKRISRLIINKIPNKFQFKGTSYNNMVVRFQSTNNNNKSLLIKVYDEAKHYYKSTKLLGKNIKTSWYVANQLMKNKDITWRNSYLIKQ
jgi:hypothetical protein